MVFPKLCHLICEKNLCLSEILNAGIEELNLLYFPAVHLYDSHRNAVISWSYRDNFWSLVGDDTIQDQTNKLESYSSLVKGDLEKRGLIFVSKLKKTPKVLPWIETCVRRLKVENLSLEDSVTTLSFLSCIALLMEGWFIEFENLPRLIADVPLTAKRLQVLEILSSFQLKSFNFHGIHLFKLHFTIPHKLPSIASTSIVDQKIEDMENAGQEDKEREERVPQIADVDPTVEQEIENKRSVMCQPIKLGQSQRWTSEELRILQEIKERYNELSAAQQYDAFRKACIEGNIPFRTLKAFQRKLKRVV